MVLHSLMPISLENFFQSLEFNSSSRFFPRHFCSSESLFVELEMKLFRDATVPSLTSLNFFSQALFASTHRRPGVKNWTMTNAKNLVNRAEFPFLTQKCTIFRDFQIFQPGGPGLTGYAWTPRPFPIHFRSISDPFPHRRPHVPIQPRSARSRNPKITKNSEFLGQK